MCGSTCSMRSLAGAARQTDCSTRCWNTRPMTAAVCATRLVVSGSRSMRALSTPASVSGMLRLEDVARRPPVLAVAHHLAAIDERAQHLFEVERVALGTLQDLRPDAFGQVLDVQQVAQQFARGRGIERLEVDAGEGAAQAGLQPVDELPARRPPVGPQHADDQQRLERGKRRHLRDQFERRTVGPVQVVHDDDVGLRAGAGADGASDGVDHRGGYAIDHRVAGHAGKREPTLFAVDGEHRFVERDIERLEVEAADEGLELFAHGEGRVHLGRADDLPAERPPRIVGDRHAIGDGARLEPGGLPVAAGFAQVAQFGDQPRLAEPGFADDGDHRSGSGRQRGKAVAQQRDLPVAADERGCRGPPALGSFRVWP